MNKKTSFLYLVVLALVFSSCIKKEVTPLTDEGNTFIKFNEAPLNPIFFSPFTDIKKVDLFSLRRDANSSAELQTANTITLKQDDQMLDDYNTDNGTDYEILPDSLYSLSNASFSPAAGGYTVSFKAGDFAQDFSILLNGAKWDLSKKYGLAFSITNADGRAITDGKDKVIALISIKNKYDAVYEITGTCVDANGLYQGDYGDPAYPRQYSLATKSATQGLFYDVSWDYPNYIVINISTGGAANTGIRPVITFDPVTDEIVAMNRYSDNAVLTVGAGSKFNASDRSLDVEWTLGRWHVTEHWKFIKER